MLVENNQLQCEMPPEWQLDDWNRALYRHFFTVSPSAVVAPLVRLYVTGEELRAAAKSNSPQGSRTAFIESIKCAVGSRSLALDASDRRRLWDIKSSTPPPFLSHLFLTCMIANDHAEELRWTGNFRDRLSSVLETQSQSRLELLRPLWEDLASWSVQQNLKGAGCRQLRLPPVPDSGYHSIIGYSIRLAIPSRRDQAALASLFGHYGLNGSEPDLNAVVHVVGANIRKFSGEFGEVFREFASGLKSLPTSVLSQTAFWTAVREVALAGTPTASSDVASTGVRLELEDDDGRFWLAITSDQEIHSATIKTVVLPARRSRFRFVLTDPDGKNFIARAFLTAKTDAQTEGMLVTTREAIADGILLFEESEDYVYVLSNSYPASGQLRALVSDQLNPNFRKAVEAAGLLPQVTRSSHPGWFEWRGLTAEELRLVNFSTVASLSAVRSLRPTLMPPSIKFRGGIQFGTGFVALSNALPHVEVPAAESVSIQTASGDWFPLQRLEGREDSWHFNETLSPEQLHGTRRVVAFAASVPVAEQEISFVESAFTTDYKRPSDQSRWLIETTRIDTIPLSDEYVLTTPVQQKPESRHRDQITRMPVSAVEYVEEPAPLLQLTTLLCVRFAAQRGISEGTLVGIMASVLDLKVSEVWPILRGWIEGGMLDVLTDARWRARIYFARVPQLVIHRLGTHYEAVLTGLVPPFLRERFHRLSALSGLGPVESRSASEAVPPLPRCRSRRLDLLTDLARELSLPALAEVRRLDDILAPVQSLAERHTSTTQDSWPAYRHWDWKRRVFMENPGEKISSGISVQWCRRDDAPDRYKLYRDESQIWWTRSRTWAILAAFTFAGLPVFELEPGAVIESYGDSLYLPLPIARVVSWTGPTNPGPVTTLDGKAGYRYTFYGKRLRDFVMDALWPSRAATSKKSQSGRMRSLASIIRSGNGPLVPLPAALRRSLLKLHARDSFQAPSFVPASALPELYAVLGVRNKGDV